MNRAVDISYIIICYNDGSTLARAAASAALASKASGLDYEIFTVDNGSQDNTANVIRELKQALGSRLKPISFDHNTGTTYSRNRALGRAKGTYLCIMDADAELVSQDLRPLLDLFSKIPELGIIGPKNLVPDGSVYDSAKRLPTLGAKLLKLPSLLPGLPRVNLDWYADFPFTKARTVHTVISCCWFMRRDLYELVGPLDENIFYAPEDVDYCLRAWRAGRAVVYYPDFEILHHINQISHKNPFSNIAYSHFKGLLYYFRKHGYFFSLKGPKRKWIDRLAANVDRKLSRAGL